ncbi:FtsK/SpoIIIE domain-containing protein [Streptomyces griseorubiginosus]|uniref:FtsK/SpoIIIE domain-containing protein n=1 Tax=Streptomyces griseorubiginosus TaxID=67304 RepID=UPI002E80518E|nr:FtsK/SpoIIIE domain-containing protein [Streptomyces griseorubiginosus]WUB45315.1 FtsK/SpoIIIE domain-containing protein [Streptomyces griseorubiginosus]WUB53832.1 FtsK/SpoIIIE domain-containing protein [Streptomyces griseorubiginosus]
MTENVVQLYKDTQDAQDSDTVPSVLTETIIDVIQDAEPRPVDPPAEQEPAGTWIAERQAYLADAPPVVPAALRRWDVFKDTVRWAASYYGHVTGFHALRAPVYLGRLLLRSPRGAGRLIVRWGKWVADTEARPVEAKAAASADIEAWLSLSREHSRRVRPRRIASIVIATTTGITTLVSSFLVPGWTLAAAIAATALVGTAGKKGDRPLITRYVATNVLRRLDSTEVFDALAAIGIEGKKGRRGVEFAAEVMRDGPGWRAEVDLPPGIEATAVLEKRAALAAAMRRPISTVWPEADRTAHPGRLVLWVASRDPAKAGRKLWPLMKDGQADVYEPLPYGFDPRGNLVEITLMYSNLLVGGIPGSGKTSCALAIVLGVALDPTAELWIYELKGSGDLDSVKPVCHRYVSGDEDEDLEAALAGMRSGIAEYQRRAAFIRSLPASEVPEGRKVTRALAEKYPEQNLGPRVIVIDEVQELFTHDDYKDEAAALATRLIKKARAYGIILILLTQNPDAPSLPSSVSSSVGTRLCLAVMDWRANNNVLGTGAYDRGLRATDISIDEQGTGILARGREGTTVRAAFIKQTEADDIAKRALALRIAAGTLTGQSVGAVVEEQDVETVVDHLRAIWPDGIESVHSHRLVEALARYRADLYAPWTEMDTAAASTALSAALKPFKVSTRQITIRECCGGAKGLRWVDIAPSEESE